MGRMIFPQGNVPILSNPNGYRDDPSVVSTIAQMFQARKQAREGNEQQIAAVFESQAAKLDPETRAKYYADFVAKYPEAGKWLKGYDVSRPETIDEQVAKRQGQATLGALDRESTLDPNSVEAKIYGYARAIGKNPTPAMIDEFIRRGTLTPEEYKQAIKIRNDMALSADQAQRSKDRRFDTTTRAETSRANTNAVVAGRERVAATNPAKPKGGESGKTPPQLASLAEDLKRLSDKETALLTEWAALDKGTSEHRVKEQQIIQVRALIDQRKKAFASWAQRFGFRGGPAAALPRSSNDLIYKGPNPDPEVIPDEMAPAQPEDVAPPQASAGNTITREELAKMQVSEEEAAELGYEVVD